MDRGRWLRRLLAAGLVLTGAIVVGAPAAAAPCTGPRCYRYWADITITAWTDWWGLPVFPGSTHTYTARVTNTGWRTGGLSGPIPWSPGPASGTVYVAFEPSTPADVRLGCRVDIGPPAGCSAGYNNGLVLDVGSIPTDTTYQVATMFRAPMTPGTYSVTIYAHAFQGIPWTEYDPNNNSVTLTYQVGYLA
jgi:hypothetical protein